MRSKSEHHRLCSKYLVDGYGTLIHATYEESSNIHHLEVLHSNMCELWTEPSTLIRVNLELTSETNDSPMIV